MPGTNDTNTTHARTPEQACDYFLTVAEFDPAAVITFRSDAHLAQHNALRGLEVVLQYADRIKKELPGVDLERICELQPLTHAVIFAAGRVNRAPESTLLRDLMPEAYQLRRRVLATAVALSEAGLLPQREVEAIHEGRGKVDAAGDLIQLPALFRRHAAVIAGKHPVEKAELERAEALGQQLLEILRPGAAPSTTAVNPELAALVDARDRLWTLLSARHEELWRVGAWLFGYEVDDKVPALQSRKLKRKMVETPVPVVPTDGPVG